MDDTVRDAVFGNVGTMITFRVSADDAPILAKPFAPQFDPEDLLQMANRNFVINMVIGGEKAPAFSAKTLSLPPIQSDNSAQIVELSRRSYSREREIVEAEIRTLLEKATPQQQPPQPAKNWVSGTMQSSQPTHEGDSQKKRTRSRSRKKNPQIQML